MKHLQSLCVCVCVSATDCLSSRFINHPRLESGHYSTEKVLSLLLIPEGQVLALSAACPVAVIIRDPCIAGGNHYMYQELQCAEKLAAKLAECLSTEKTIMVINIVLQKAFSLRLL